MKTKLVIETGKSALIASALLVSGAGATQADAACTNYAFGGDVMFSNYSGATQSNSDLIRPFYIPSSILVEDTNGDNAANVQARESRRFFKADTVTKGGAKISDYVEIDFGPRPMVINWSQIHSDRVYGMHS